MFITFKKKEKCCRYKKNRKIRIITQFKTNIININNRNFYKSLSFPKNKL